MEGKKVWNANKKLGIAVEGGMTGESASPGDKQKAKDPEENINVTVRVRPLSSKEVTKGETMDWECTNDQTIAFNHSLPERSPYPSSYTFDRVFGPDCSTKQVYSDGAKKVALSALTGINSTIFAYGQTSSGKTYTMRGIVQCTIIDIYNHVEKNKEREFVLKISGLEIYNEVVKDLLNPDSGPLRLLDDPDRGTVVERLKEEVVRDYDHLQKIIKVCEAQRQVGETMLNDTSSRSHQIIRLTVESYPCGVADGSPLKSFIASLNFVDLAGSERACQTLSEGSRLKEGCHINRSLLTLSSVIRKLSGGSKNKTSGHIPYRDSKLTRILQHSLGGNARTAIICTMSPAHSHVEQSRNTLFFATRAKEVTNTARVNLVVSDKILVKQLQKEVARLEAELRAPEISLSSEALLKEKELQILKMESEMKELALQRDLAQLRLDELLKKLEAGDQTKLVEKMPSACHRPPPGLGIEQDTVLYEDEEGDMTKIGAVANQLQLDRRRNRSIGLRQSTASSLMLVQEIRKLEHLQEEVGEDANKALEALQKEIECLRLAQAGMNNDAAATIARLQAEIQELHKQRASTGEKNASDTVLKTIDASLIDEISRLQARGENDKIKADATIATLEQQLESVQMSLDNMMLGSPASNILTETPSPTNSASYSVQEKTPPTLGRGSSTRQRLFVGDPSSSPNCRRSFGHEHNENTPPQIAENSSPHVFSTSKRRASRKAERGTSSKESPTVHRRINPVDVRKMQSMFKTAAEENIKSIRAYVTELKERVAKLQYQKQLLVCQVLELEANGTAGDESDGVIKEESHVPFIQSPSKWLASFEQQRMQIIELWEICQVSIIHRTQFYLLFSGDPADAIYLEVELRRLAWLKEHMSETDLQILATYPDENIGFLSASCRNLKREREMLAKRMRIQLPPEERDELFIKWNIPLDTKQRKLQLACKIWTDPHDMDHIKASADVVARAVGVWDSGSASKEMFELNFAPPSSQKPWFSGWNPLSTWLNL